MKRILNKSIKDEAGYTLILVLILLLVGGLILAPLLGFMGSGLIAGQAYEKNVAELYAADAGVEDAIWELINGLEVEVGFPDTLPTFNMNDKDVDVIIESLPVEEEEPPVYRITSTANSDDSSTTIESIFASMYGDFSGILENVITSQGDFTESGPCNIIPSEGDHSPVTDYGGDWPTPEELSSWYWSDVKNVDPYTIVGGNPARFIKKRILD